jgi:hypothetical protein
MATMGELTFNFRAKGSFTAFNLAFGKEENNSKLRSRNNQQYALIVPLVYSIHWLLHVLAVACHHQRAS